MEAFLAAIDELEGAVSHSMDQKSKCEICAAANSVLWSNQMLNSVKEAIHHSEKLWNDAMNACESDYALTLTNGSKV